jgi:hypothetical protein
MWAYLYDAGRLVIAATLLVAGASKLANPRPLATSLATVLGLARGPGGALARTIAAAELTASFLLAAGWSVTVGLALTGLVGAGIVVFVLIAMLRGASVPCGCFGETGDRPIGPRNLFAGMALLAGPIILAVLPVTSRGFLLPLAAVAGLLAVMARDRVRLLAPFRRHFQPVAGPVPVAPIPAHRRSPHG